jgi:Ca2+/Na+ antiporter
MRRLGLGVLIFLLALATAWACAALYFDLPSPHFHVAISVAYLTVILAIIFGVRKTWLRGVLCAACFAVVLIWWLSLKPSNARPWQADVSRTAWAEMNGDRVTIHNFRDCDYRTEMDYTCQWETRTVNLADLRGVDLFIIRWGAPCIAHPILSFWFGDDNYVAFSIEQRRQVGQEYSPTRSFFRQFELIYLAGDERDFIRRRANYSGTEDVYLYHTRAGPAFSRSLFLRYIARMNSLRVHPEWYNALTNNCTTNIFTHRLAGNGAASFMERWDWRILLNGRTDKMEYQRGDLAGRLPFARLKQDALINSAAHAANKDSDFSRRIREGRPGFVGGQGEAPHTAQARN